MTSFYFMLAVVALLFGVAVAGRGRVAPRLRRLAGALAVSAAIVLVIGRISGSNSLAQRYQAAGLRQGYALGFGLGEFLKQTQPGRPLVILRASTIDARDRKTIKGLRDGLDGASRIVSEYEVDTSLETDYETTAAFFTPELLTELHRTGAEIVVSLCGMPLRVRQVDGMYQFDLQATLELWRSPEYRALQWVLARPPELSLVGEFREGGVLAVAVEKRHEGQGDDFPAHLEVEAAPAALFDAWFELITRDDES